MMIMSQLSLTIYYIHILDYYRPKSHKHSARRMHIVKPALRMQNEAPKHHGKHSLRILGGNINDTTNYPYMAAIIIDGRLWCAGSIVDVNWVLTAAHCLN